MSTQTYADLIAYQTVKQIYFLFLMLLILGNCSLVVKGQDYFKYYQLVEEASQLYDSNEYLKSGQKYSEAFIALENKGMMDRGIMYERYNAACSRALVSETDVNQTNWNHLRKSLI